MFYARCACLELVDTGGPGPKQQDAPGRLVETDVMPQGACVREAIRRADASRRLSAAIVATASG